MLGSRFPEQNASLILCKWTPLHLAANNNNVEIVGILIKSGADIKMADDA